MSAELSLPRLPSLEKTRVTEARRMSACFTTLPSTEQTPHRLSSLSLVSPKCRARIGETCLPAFHHQAICRVTSSNRASPTEWAVWPTKATTIPFRRAAARALLGDGGGLGRVSIGSLRNRHDSGVQRRERTVEETRFLLKRSGSAIFASMKASGVSHRRQSFERTKRESDASVSRK